MPGRYGDGRMPSNRRPRTHIFPSTDGRNPQSARRKSPQIPLFPQPARGPASNDFRICDKLHLPRITVVNHVSSCLMPPNFETSNLKHSSPLFYGLFGMLQILLRFETSGALRQTVKASTFARVRPPRPMGETTNSPERARPKDDLNVFLVWTQKLFAVNYLMEAHHPELKYEFVRP